jgi:hypothetical protein
MSDTNDAQGILDVIHTITSKRESGQLEISSSGSHGILLFNEGRLVDARLESLTGFQAVNAAVSLRDVQFSFNPSILAPRSSSIAPNERVVLQRFFGIETAEMDHSDTQVESEVDWNMTPHQVVPLAEVDQIAQDELEETPTVEVKRVALPVQEEVLPETAFPVLLRRPIAVYAMLLVLILAVGMIAVIPKLKARYQSASQASAGARQSSPASAEPESRIAEVEKESLPESAHQAEQVASKSSSTAVTQQETPRVKSGAPSTSVAAAQRDEATARDETAHRDDSAPRDRTVHDLSGEWKIINTVQKTAYKSFGNMEIGFRLRIEQNGKDFTARGEKVSENGRNLPVASRTPIRVNGSIDGDKVVATFIEDGTVRRTNGRFTWKLQGENSALSGTFVSAAANSSGKSAAIRQP